MESLGVGLASFVVIVLAGWSSVIFAAVAGGSLLMDAGSGIIRFPVPMYRRSATAGRIAVAPALTDSSPYHSSWNQNRRDRGRARRVSPTGLREG